MAKNTPLSRLRFWAIGANWVALALLHALSLVLTPVAAAEESHPGLSIEPLYAEAVIAFNRKQPQKALQILTELLKSAPNHIQALELRALSAKSAGDSRQAAESYRKLLLLKPESERGPYYFELGVLYHRAKMPQYAIPYFQRAIRLHINEHSSHLFIGLSYYTTGKLNAAESHFEEVTGSEDPELAMAGHYYLGVIHLKNGFGALGTGEIIEARNAARKLDTSALAKDILKSTDQMLAPFDKGQAFGNFALLAQYDSNIVQAPLEGLSATNSATVKSTISAGGGWMSSPMKTLQWVASLRFSANRNFAAGLSGYEFSSILPSLYLTYKPMGRTSFGLRTDGAASFQNAAGASSIASFNYGLFSAGVDAGPFMRIQSTPRLLMQADTSFRYASYPVFSDFTGFSAGGRFSFRYTGENQFFNPGTLVGGDANFAQSDSWKYYSVSVGANNLFRFTKDLSLTTALDFSFSSYFLTTRSDSNIAARANFVWQISPKWAALADASAVMNISTVSGSYSYNRFGGGLGVGYSF